VVSVYRCSRIKTWNPPWKAGFDPLAPVRAVSIEVIFKADSGRFEKGEGNVTEKDILAVCFSGVSLSLDKNYKVTGASWFSANMSKKNQSSEDDVLKWKVMPDYEGEIEELKRKLTESRKTIKSYKTKIDSLAEAFHSVTEEKKELEKKVDLLESLVRRNERVVKAQEEKIKGLNDGYGHYEAQTKRYGNILIVYNRLTKKRMKYDFEKINPNSWKVTDVNFGDNTVLVVKTNEGTKKILEPLYDTIKNEYKHYLDDKRRKVDSATDWIKTAKKKLRDKDYRPTDELDEILSVLQKHIGVGGRFSPKTIKENTSVQRTAIQNWLGKLAKCGVVEHKNRGIYIVR